jgi:UDP-glucose 4-epimerase
MILVTGGAGFIGSNLIDRLVEEGGERVVTIDNLITGNVKNISTKADFIHGCVESFDFRRIDMIGKPRVIFHLAALARIQPSFHEPLETYKANCLSTMAVLDYARKHGTKVVFAGSSSAYHDVFANPYSYSKFVSEEHCKLYHRVYKLPIAIARFFNVYGPRQLEEGAYATVIGIFEKQWREGKPLTVTGTGEQRRDFTHVSDIVSGLIALSKVEVGEEIFNLGTGRNYSINEVAKMFGTNITYIPARPGEAWVTLADIKRSKDVLGYNPQGNLAEYVRHQTGASSGCNLPSEQTLVGV